MRSETSESHPAADTQHVGAETGRPQVGTKEIERRRASAATLKPGVTPTASMIISCSVMRKVPRSYNIPSSRAVRRSAAVTVSTCVP
jgi:hypothetical protein